MATGQAAGTSERVTADSLVIRKCHELDEIRACVALQKEVWNFTDLELVPLRMFVVAEKVGGQVIGAFDGKEIVGFALSIPGARAATPICIRTCWRFASGTAMPGLAAASSCFSARTPSRAVTCRSRGMLIRWIYKMPTYISMNSA